MSGDRPCLIRSNDCVGRYGYPLHFVIRCLNSVVQYDVPFQLSYTLFRFYWSLRRSDQSCDTVFRFGFQYSVLIQLSDYVCQYLVAKSNFATQVLTLGFRPSLSSTPYRLCRPLRFSIKMYDTVFRFSCTIWCSYSVVIYALPILSAATALLFSCVNGVLIQMLNMVVIFNCLITVSDNLKYLVWRNLISAPQL